MKLNRLNIERVRWGKDEGKLMGEIEIDGQYAKVSIKLNEEKAFQMLDLVADALVEQAHENAKILRSDFLRPEAQIEGEVQ